MFPRGVELLHRIEGHWATVAPVVRHAIQPRAHAPAVHWSKVVEDPTLGPVRLTGRLTEHAGKDLIVIVHGLGGSADSPYVIETTRAADDAGISCLAMNLRGADRSGQDIYHGGLTDDVAAVFDDRSLARFEHVTLLGYSLGGHCVLRYASMDPDPRLRAVAAVCSPVHLGRAGAAFDQQSYLPYRFNVIKGLREIYTLAADRLRLEISLEVVARIREMREWDDRIVARRFGFNGADHYYREASAATRLPDLHVPTLFVLAENDPMLHPDTVRPFLQDLPSHAEVRWFPSGGHVAFRRGFSLGLDAALGLEAQVIAWLRQFGAREKYA